MAPKVQTTDANTKIYGINIRRQKIVQIYHALLPWLFAPGAMFHVTKGLPGDAQVLSVESDVARGLLRITMLHPSFPVVEYGSLPEAIDVQIEDLHELSLEDIASRLLS